MSAEENQAVHDNIHMLEIQRDTLKHTVDELLAQNINLRVALSMAEKKLAQLVGQQQQAAADASDTSDDDTDAVKPAAVSKKKK